MVQLKRHGSVKRFGPRYGRRVKDKVAMVEASSLHNRLCPYCRIAKASRLASGIWHCSKCQSKFTGRAYTVTKESRSTVASEGLEVTEEIEE